MNQMKLEEAVRLLYYTSDRDQKRLEAAREIVYRELKRLGQFPRLLSFERSLGEGCVEDAIQKVILEASLREVPLQGDPPSSEGKATAFLYRCLWSRLVSDYRKNVRRNQVIIATNDIEGRGEPDRSSLPGPAESAKGSRETAPLEEDSPLRPEDFLRTDDVDRGTVDLQGIDVEDVPASLLDALELDPRLERREPDDTSPEKEVLEMLDALSEWRRRAEIEQLRVNPTKVPRGSESQDPWPAIRDGILDAYRGLRSQADRARFAVTFRRLVHTCLGLTTMDQEVESEVAARGGNSPPAPQELKKVRNALDQQNSRTLERIYHAIIERGLSEDNARAFVSALSVRGHRARSENPKGEEPAGVRNEDSDSSS